MLYGPERKCQLVGGGGGRREAAEMDVEADVDGDEGAGCEWTPYGERPEWADIVPVPQDDGPDPVVAIVYSPKFRDVYDYFRAVLQKREMSKRALELTQDALDLNSANYTVWQYRREVLEALDADLYEELDYLLQVIDSNPKNYQVWHHRRVIVERMNDPSLELELTASVLQQDPKNYHAWQHRQWVMKTYNLFENELEYVDNLLSEDVRNNSAWNQRYFVIANTTGFTEDVIEREVAYTINKIRFIKTNESSWNFLRGVLLHDRGGLRGNLTVSTFCEELYDASNRSPYLLAFIIDICDEAVEHNQETPVYNSQRGSQLCKDMAEKYDKIRAKYWTYISRKFVHQDMSELKLGDSKEILNNIVASENSINDKD